VGFKEYRLIIEITKAISVDTHLQYSVHLDLLLDISTTTTLKTFLKIAFESSGSICLIHDPLFVYGANRRSHALTPYTRTSKRRLYVAIAKHLPYEGKENHEEGVFRAERCFSISFR
jgi:hypothetical protein